MSAKARTLTRSDLSDKISRSLGLSRQQSVEVLESALSLLAKGLQKEGHVKISSFGTFHVRAKNERIGRNPKTGKEVMITPRHSLSFRASTILKDSVERGHRRRA